MIGWLRKLRDWWDRPFQDFQEQARAERLAQWPEPNPVKAHIDFLRTPDRDNIEEWLDKASEADDYVMLEAEYVLAMERVNALDSNDPAYPRARLHADDVERRFAAERGRRRMQEKYRRPPPDPGIPENRTKPECFHPNDVQLSDFSWHCPDCGRDLP